MVAQTQSATSIGWVSLASVAGLNAGVLQLRFRMTAKNKQQQRQKQLQLQKQIPCGNDNKKSNSKSKNNSKSNGDYATGEYQGCWFRPSWG